MPARRQAGRVRPGWVIAVLVLAGALAYLASAARDPAHRLHALWTRVSGAASEQGGPGAPARGGSDRRPGAGGTPVSVADARLQDISVSVDAIGTVVARRTAVVRARVDGDLLTVRFAEGERVESGQLLAEIDAAPFRIALAQAEAALARDQAQSTAAHRDLQRFEGLLARDAIARQQVETQRALVAQLDATLKADRAQVDQARLQLSYTRITAPIAGVAGLRQIDAGNRVRASDANGLVTIVQVEPVDVVFSVPEALLPLIRRQRAAKRELPVTLFDRDRSERLAEGRLSTLDNAIDPATGSIRAKAAFPNRDRALYPNQFVNVRLGLETLHGVLAVPSAAIQRAARGATVSVVGPDMKLSVRSVTTGQTDGQWVEVHGELKAGERVVVDGAERVAAGATVRIVEPVGASGDERPAWVRRLPPAEADEVMKLAPDKRRAWMLERIDRRVAETEALFAAGKRPDWWSRVSPDAQQRLLALTPEQRAAWMRQRGIERAGLDDGR